MMSRHLEVLLGHLAAVTASAALHASPARAAEPDTGGRAPGLPRVPIENGGFERWVPLDPGIVNGWDNVRCLGNKADGQSPPPWMPATEDLQERRRTGSVSRDEAVRHSGHSSVRIENGSRKDITLLSYSTEPLAKKPDDPHVIKPGHYYILRWWQKGESIDCSAGPGPIMMMFCQLSGQDGRDREYLSEHIARPSSGTFEWKQRSFTFITPPDTRWVVIGLQLRWATGTVWYDDVELLDVGPVVAVETY